MIRPCLCDYSEAYIHVIGTTTMPNTGTAVAPNNIKKKIIFKNCGPFTNYISKINNTQIDYANNIDVVMPMYDLREYSDINSKKSRSLWHYYRDKPALDGTININGFPADNNNSISFKFKETITRKTVDNGTKVVEIMVPLKHLSNLSRPLK